MAPKDWTEDRIALLRRHWGTDKTAREIAEMIGMSRNAVIGKAQRLGLGSGPPPPTKRAERLLGSPRKRRQAQVEAARMVLLAQCAGGAAAVAASRAAPLAGSPKLAAVPTRRITMSELTEHACRYPYGDRPSELMFCGRAVMERDGRPASYCPDHEARCYVPPDNRRPGNPHTGRKRGRLSLAIPT